MQDFRWMDDGICRNSGLDFFKKTPTREVRAMCQACLVRNECAEYAIVREIHGFWGGLTEDERKKERRRRRIPEPQYAFIEVRTKAAEPKPIEHGTPRGYESHRRFSIPFETEDGQDCGCRKANADYIRAYRKKKAEQKA